MLIALGGIALLVLLAFAAFLRRRFRPGARPKVANCQEPLRQAAPGEVEKIVEVERTAAPLERAGRGPDAAAYVADYGRFLVLPPVFR